MNHLIRIAATALLGFMLTSCSRKADTSAVSGKLAGQNLLLVTLDTTRADRLGCYGHKGAATPTLDGLAARGALFENSFAQVPLTLPSHCSIMTGRYPREHGVRDNGANALGTSHPTLAGIFKEKGYDTGAFLASFVLDSRFGLERGFDTYNDDMGVVTFKIQPLEWQQPADVVTDRALVWLESKKDRPFLCWVHYYDPHQPYLPPPEFRKPDIGPHDAELAYDAELAFVDTQIKRLVDWLGAAKLTEKTLVVVVGDHGEAFNEHGERGHSNFVYDVNIRVPMMFAHPSVVSDPKRLGAIVEALDVFPTVLDLFGFEAPKGLLSRSLSAGLAGEKLDNAPAYAESHFVFNSFGWAEQRSLTTDRWKYVSSSKPELFDRKADPGEKQNVAASQPKVASKMLSDLKARYDSMTPGQAAVAKIDQDVRSAMASMGYIGGSTKATDEFITEGLADPKDHLHLLTQLKIAHDIMEHAPERKDKAKALPLLRNVVRESPTSRLFQFMLGSCLFETGELEEALQVFQAAQKLDPENPQTYGVLATTLARLERTDEALKHFVISLGYDDQSSDTHFQYAELLLRLGRSDEAIAHYEKAVELFPSFAAAHFRLSHALKQKERKEEAKQHLDQAIALFQESLTRSPQDADMHFRLGMAYVQAERVSEAITKFRDALRLQPTHGEALFNLGVSLESQGEVRESEEMLRRATADDQIAAEAYHALGVLMNKQGKVEEAVVLYEQAIALNPAKSLAVEELSGFYLGKGRIGDAIRVLRLAAAKMPNNVKVLNSLAKLLATAQDASLRDCQTALTLATKAAELTQNKEPSVLAGLAAAHAECGDFPKAADTARKAGQLAEEAKQGELAALIRTQLDGYMKNQPYRDPRTKATP